MKKIDYKKYSGIVKRSFYSDNINLALVLVDAEDGGVISNITVNTNEKLPDDCGYLKDYSENEGMLEACEEMGLVAEILGYKQLGFVTAPLVRFNMEDIEELDMY